MPCSSSDDRYPRPVSCFTLKATDGAARAGTVVDQYRCTPQVGERAGNVTGREVSTTARRVADDQPYRLGRIIRLGRRR